MIDTAKRKALFKQMILVLALEENSKSFITTPSCASRKVEDDPKKSKSCCAPRGARCDANAKPIS